MKHQKSIVIVMFIGFVGAQSYQPAYSSCEGVPSNINVLLPNPNDCGSYIQCVHGSPVVQSCPTGLHWSVAANRCEWPELANCNRNFCEGVPETENVLKPNPDDCGTYIQCVHQKPVVRACPAGLHWSEISNRCDWPEVAHCSISSRSIKNCIGVPHDQIVLLPNPENCSTYFECVHGLAELMPCPVGLKWNDVIKQCDYPENSQCQEPAFLKINWGACIGVPHDQIVLLPNPENCSTYFECVHGTPELMPCPIGLKWNDAAKQCDYAENSQCQEPASSKTNLSSCEGVPEDEIVLLPNPGNCSTYILCTYGKPVVMACPGNLQWNDELKQCDYPETAQCEQLKKKSFSCEGVPSNINKLLPNPADCRSYIQCVHGSPVVQPCPAGLHWSVASNRCDWPQLANCKRNSCEGVPATQDVLLPNPDDCGTYIQCVHQAPIIRSCPAGLHWSVSSRTCDWPSIANCES